MCDYGVVDLSAHSLHSCDIEQRFFMVRESNMIAIIVHLNHCNKYYEHDREKVKGVGHFFILQWPMDPFCLLLLLPPHA